MNLKPSNFKDHFPWGCKFHNDACEHEIVAMNLIIIMSEQFNVFKPLTWEEYVDARRRGKGFSAIEKPFFENVKYLCEGNLKDLSEFSPVWKKVVESI